MSRPNPTLDLSGLARKEVMPRPPRRWLRTVIPLAVLGAFGALLLWSSGLGWRRPLLVTVVRPLPLAAGAEAGTGGPARVVLQAAGWIEPDPFPLLATPLVEGVVREMLVQPADRVAEGDVLAVLDDQEARLEVEAARARLAEVRAVARGAKEEAAIARQEFDLALALTERLDATRALGRGGAAEALRAQAAARGAEAALCVAEEELLLQRCLAENGAAGPRQVELAEARRAEADAARAAADAAAERASAESEERVARLARVEKEWEVRLAERLALERALAADGEAAALAALREAELAAAELRLERMAVRAPASGVVLERLAGPGSAVGGAENGAVCSLYDPAALRVRVDVPQQEIAKVRPGQAAEISAEAAGNEILAGEVTRIEAKADIQKVTLRVHVRVAEEGALLRPEMLCQVRFLDGGGEGAAW
ncbi:MAG: efflux RND transporter periplasmic adaptor subunit [Planctomycetes bacterium]|nr:efflux RND transporter periplasmic adaptor subunit [Planctomycetota bacterium]